MSKPAVRLCFGLAIIGLLLAGSGLTAALKLALSAGPVLLLLIPLHGLPMLLAVRGWQNLLPHKVPATRLLWFTLIREAADGLPLFANSGKDPIGIRMLVGTASADGPTATASVTVESLLTLVAHCLFVVIGGICLLEVATAAGLVAGTCALIGLVIVSRLSARSSRIYIATEVLGSQPAQLSKTIAWQLSGLLVGCAETWLALHWLGFPITAPESVALESVAQAARRFFFMIPAGLGVQEQGLVGVGHLMGLDPQTALALSIIKRMREAAIGLPSLLALHLKDGRDWQRDYRNQA